MNATAFCHVIKKVSKNTLNFRYIHATCLNTQILHLFSPSSRSLHASLATNSFSQTRHEFVSRPHNQSILHRQMESHGHYLRFLTFPLGRNQEERRKKWRGEQVGGKGKQKHWERDSETESERETTRARSKRGRIREISSLTFGTTNTSPERKSEGERWGDRDRESRKKKQEIAEKTW